MKTVSQLDTNEIEELSKTFDQYLASKTSSALSTLFSEPIKHKIKILDGGLSKIKEIQIPKDEIMMCGVRLNGKGDTHIEICYTMKLKHAKKIAAKLLCQNDLSEIDEMGASAIQEVANILTGSFFNAMTKGTGFRVDLSTPDFALGELEPLVTVCASDAANTSECALIADAQLEGQDSGIKIHMIIIQDHENARKLLSNNKISSSDKEFVKQYAESASTGAPKENLTSEIKEKSKFGIGSINPELEKITSELLEDSDA